MHTYWQKIRVLISRIMCTAGSCGARGKRSPEAAARHSQSSRAHTDAKYENTQSGNPAKSGRGTKIRPLRGARARISRIHISELDSHSLCPYGLWLTASGVRRLRGYKSACRAPADWARLKLTASFLARLRGSKPKSPGWRSPPWSI